VFAWLGRRASRYTIRIIGPSGLVLERRDLAGMKVTYPPEAPPLAAGVRYHAQGITEGEPPQEVWFEMVDPVRSETIRRDLAELAAADGPMLSPNTLVAVQSAYLANRGLLVDSRRTPVRYERLGLPEQAAGSFARAQLLLQGHTRR
jgi:hypothetical protein